MLSNWSRVLWVIGLTLAILTVGEYIIAVELEDNLVPLVVAAVAKAALIVWYFMHLQRVWRAREAH